ncbi:MAG: universal stress protein [Micrococcales bacterium]|nr:universal stress protein [Micrococcales bacterium]
MSPAEHVESPAAATDPTDEADPEGHESDAVPPGAIVAGVDGSDKDASVLDFAALEAGRSRAPLHLIMAHEIHTGIVGTWDAGFALDGMATELATATAERLHLIASGVKEAHPHLDVSTSHPWGTPSQVLLDAAAEALLVVVGTERKSGLARVLLGTTSLDTAMHAACPVAVVGLDPIRSGPVVVGVDGSRHAVAAARWGASAAAARGVGLVVVTTWWLEVIRGVVITEEGTPEWEELTSRYRAMAECALGEVRADHPHLPIDVIVRNDRPVSALLEASADASLLVVGTRGRGGFAGMTLGSVSHKVLQRAACPVVVTRAAPG